MPGVLRLIGLRSIADYISLGQNPTAADRYWAGDPLPILTGTERVEFLKE